ncbi:DUF2306 domain-containing protein [Ekhidna sp.]
MRLLISKSFIILGSISMAVMASAYFIYTKNSFFDAKPLSSELWYAIVFKTHIALGIISIVAGAYQFIRMFRKSWTSLHRIVGKVYVLSIFISAPCGLIAAQFATGGLITRLGFSILAILWFCFTYLAYHHIKLGDVEKHRIWMYRSFALTFSSLTLRLFLLIALFNPIGFVVVYQFASWGSWIVNIFVCEMILHNANKKRMIPNPKV